MNCEYLLKKLSEYKKVSCELEQANSNYSNVKSMTESEVGVRFDTLANNIQRFCSSESFKSVIKNFCYLYSNILSVEGGNLAYRGSVPSALPFNSDNASTLAERCVADIKSSFRMLAEKIGNTDAEIKKLCTSFATLRMINARADELKAEAVRKDMAKEDRRIDGIRERMSALVRACPELEHPEEIEQMVFGVKQSINDEIDRFNFKNITVPSDYSAEISLPFAKRRADNEYESGITYWNPTKDGILHVNIESGRYEVASDFIIALTMQFLHSYPQMKKQILYCCQNSLSKMDIFLKALSDIGESSIFFSGKEQFEADLFYQQISEYLKKLRDEVKHRSSLMDAVLAEDIYEYNAMENVDILSPILVFLHDYPTGYSGCKDLGYFFRECARYGIFFAVIQTGVPEKYASNELCNPSEYRGINCTLCDNGQIKLGVNTYESAYIDKQRIRQLLQNLADNSNSIKKKVYIPYEEIGFGNIDHSAESDYTKISIPIGKIDNNPFSLDFSVKPSNEDKKKGIQTPLAYFVIGGPGSGKSALIDTLIINGSMAYSPDDLMFYLLDFKDGVTASFYDKPNAIPHVHMIASKSQQEESDLILSSLITEMNQRNTLFKAHSTGDIVGYTKKRGNKMPRIIVIVDECQNLFADDLLSKKCEKIAREGRSTGIHLVLASQNLNFNMKKHAGDFIDGRICFHTPNRDVASAVINESYTKSLDVDLKKGSGQAYLSLDGGNTCKKIQTAFFGEDADKLNYNRQIREKWGKLGYGINLVKAGEKTPLFMDDFADDENPLITKRPNIATFGKNYFDHSSFGIDLSSHDSHSVALLGKEEEPSNCILTSIMTKALSLGAEIKLIDESLKTPLKTLFETYPNVTMYSKDTYLDALSSVYEEYMIRKADFRSSYRPYFFIINSLYRINDYVADTTLRKLDINTFSGDIKDFSSAYDRVGAIGGSDVYGKKTLLNMLASISDAVNMYIIIATHLDFDKDYVLRNAFGGCGYKILQSNVSKLADCVLDNSFNVNMMSNMDENLVFVSNDGNYIKCRYYQYDWESDVTKKHIVNAAKKTTKDSK